jgi:hypothetical protein
MEKHYLLLNDNDKLRVITLLVSDSRSSLSPRLCEYAYAWAG